MAETIGRYEILEEIGRGGFAIVHRARDTELVRDVALKELRPILLDDKTWVTRFQQEARAIAQLDHPSIVPIYDVYNTRNRMFLVMRLVNGPDLSELISIRSRIPWPEAVGIIEAVAAGLDYAHRQNILHRDLKPSNILVDIDRGPMLSDFGLAKLVGENSLSVSASGSVVGTPHYIAPEVWEGKGSSRQSDIYALGCILFEMVTGKKVFRGETPPVVMMSHFQPLTLPVSWPTGVPNEITAVLQKALAQNPAERFATAGQMAAAVKKLSSQDASQMTVLAAEYPQAPILPAPEQSLGAESRLLESSDSTESTSPEGMSMDSFGDDDKDDNASWRSFFSHLGPYVIVIGLLAVINFMTGNYPWFLWPAIAWGIGIAFHFWAVASKNLVTLEGKWRGVLEHLVAYAIVISALITMNLLSSGYPWAIWPAVAWGAGVLIHVWITALGNEQAQNRGSMRDNRKQRKKRRQSKRQQSAGGQTAGAQVAAVPGNALDPTLQEHLAKARAYRKQIDSLVKITPNPQIQTNLQEIAVQVTQWTHAVEDLVSRIDSFQKNSLIQHDLQTVPQAIEKLQAKLDTEIDPGTRDELVRALTNRRNQWQILQHLQNTMHRAEIKIENTLSLLGTLYPQILASQSTNQVADYSRITSEVSEEVRVLNDHLAALEEVKFGQANFAN